MPPEPTYYDVMVDLVPLFPIMAVVVLMIATLFPYEEKTVARIAATRPVRKPDATAGKERS